METYDIEGWLKGRAFWEVRKVVNLLRTMGQL